MPTDLEVSYSCEQVIYLTYRSRQDISDLPLQDPKEVWITGESTLVQERHQKGGYAAVISQQVTEANFPQGILLKVQS